MNMNDCENLCSYEVIPSFVGNKIRKEHPFFESNFSNFDHSMLDIEENDFTFNNEMEVTSATPECLNYCKLSKQTESVSSSPLVSTNSTSEFQSITSTDHRASCHRCGNMRKSVLQCGRCPYIFCERCMEKMQEEHGLDIFEGGCPVCKGVCCCGVNRSMDCSKKYHCYKKCPTTRSNSPRTSPSLKRHRITICSPAKKVSKADEEGTDLKNLRISSSNMHVTIAASQSPIQTNSDSQHPISPNFQATPPFVSHQSACSQSFRFPSEGKHSKKKNSNLKTLLDDAMRNFSSILSPTSLMPEVNPFFLQSSLGFLTNVGNAVAKLPPINAIAPATQGFFTDSNRLICPVDKSLAFYLPFVCEKEVRDDCHSDSAVRKVDECDLPSFNQYKEIMSQNLDLVHRLLQQEHEKTSSDEGRATERPVSVSYATPPGPEPCSDAMQFCRDWLQHQADIANKIQTPKTECGPSVKTRLGQHCESSLERQKDLSSPIQFDALFNEYPAASDTSRCSQADSVAAYMNLSIMTPGFTPMILSHIANKSNDSACLESNSYMFDSIGEILPEDLFVWQTPTAPPQPPEPSRPPSNDLMDFAPLLTNVSGDTNHESQPNKEEADDDFSLSKIDCTPILGNDYRCSQSQSQFQSHSLPSEQAATSCDGDRLMNLDGKADPIAIVDHENYCGTEAAPSQPIDTTLATESSQSGHLHNSFEAFPAIAFSPSRSPDSLAMVCTELYTKLLSDETGLTENASHIATISPEPTNHQRKKRTDRLKATYKPKRAVVSNEFDDSIFEKDEGGEGCHQ